MRDGFYIKPEYIRNLSRNMRKQPTLAEEVLWKYLRSNALGVKFYRQKPLFAYEENAGFDRFFIVDFYCHTKNLIVEVDGLIHESTKEYDSMRDNLSLAKGYTVLRFTNEQVLDPVKIQEVVDLISKKISEL